MRLAITSVVVFFFLNDTATTEISPLPLQRRSSDLTMPNGTQIPISATLLSVNQSGGNGSVNAEGEVESGTKASTAAKRSEEHTSELQSPCNLVCRLLLEKKKNTRLRFITYLTLAQA